MGIAWESLARANTHRGKPYQKPIVEEPSPEVVQTMRLQRERERDREYYLRHDPLRVAVNGAEGTCWRQRAPSGE